MSLAQFAGTLYPDKSFSLGVVPGSREKEQSDEYDRLWEAQRDSFTEVVFEYGKRVLKTTEIWRGVSDYSRFIETPKSSRDLRGVYGRHGITGFGKRNVKNTAILLQQKHGKNRLGFGTCTLPSVTAEQVQFANGNIGDIIRRFFQKLQRIAKKSGGEFNYIGCVEIQEKRFKDVGLPVPHIHFIYPCYQERSRRWIISASEFRNAWGNAVMEVFKLHNMPLFLDDNGWNASVDCQIVKKSASAYLGKYLSKGSKVVESMKEKGFDQFPKQWWFACMQCKKMFKDSLIHLDSPTWQAIFDGLPHYLHEKSILFARYVYVEIGETVKQIGLYGTMSDEMYAMLSDE